ncbi:MAG: BrnT family toxin [Pyrinomonadaceae bacterium]
MDRIFELQGIEFEWNEEKYAVNLRKHSVKFEEAAEVFFDPLSVYEDASVEEEQRENVLGFSYSAKALFVIFVERGVRTRIISARPATSQERDEYARKNFEK